MKTIAVTGASGHLGTAITLEALSRGLKVRAGYSSYKPDIEHENLTWVKGDLSPGPLNELFSGVEGIIHSAAKISVHGDRDGSVKKTNVDGTANVIEACRQLESHRLVHVSSSSTLEEYPHDQPFDETRPLKGPDASAYEYSKALSEKLVLEAVRSEQLNAVIVRPSGMFGPPDLRQSKIGSMLLEIYLGKMPALISGGYDFVDMRDVAIGTVNALTQGQSGETYLLTGYYLELKTIANLLHSIGGAKVPITIPVSLLMTLLPLVRLFSYFTGSADSFTKEGLSTFRDGHPAMSSDKARTELGYQPRPINESLLDLLSWWKETGLVT